MISLVVVIASLLHHPLWFSKHFEFPVFIISGLTGYCFEGFSRDSLSENLFFRKLNRADQQHKNKTRTQQKQVRVQP